MHRGRREFPEPRADINDDAHKLLNPHRSNADPNRIDSDAYAHGERGTRPGGTGR